MKTVMIAMAMKIGVATRLRGDRRESPQMP
jgi:hypothetical protein